jgi:3-phosphoshikimate 1-carboxyvinyltransferase
MLETAPYDHLDHRKPIETLKPLTAHPVDALEGTTRLPGDKSISHRALMVGSLAVGLSEIEGLLEGEDVLCTAAAMRQLGAEVERGADGRWRVWGPGIGGLREPEDVLDMGNSGTAARLLMGVLASHPLTDPLAACGARFVGRDGARLPITVVGTGAAMPLDYRLPVASAQVKSALLLAGLNAPGETRVVEPAPTRDHSELMLRYFGAEIATRQGEQDEKQQAGERVITLAGQPELTGRPVRVPGDPSSAAFPTVAALILPGSDIRLTGVGINPQRTGLYTTLKEMGADIAFENPREEAGEPIADLRVRASKLQGIEVPAARAPSMIDEYPILAVAAAAARGRTVMQGLGELRVKESDRLAATAEALAACGVEVEAGEDSLSVIGSGKGRPRGGGRIEARLDHRIAMSFLVLGSASEQAVGVDDAAPIDTSFPGFAELMNGLGTAITGP